MSIDTAVMIIFILLFLLVISHGRASYWKGRAEVASQKDGWQEEVEFLRNHINPSAAQAAKE